MIFYVHNLYALKEFSISAIFETPQVKFNGNADDPAIWLNKNDPNLSIIFGTDKYNGIYSYNLKGETIGFSNAGSINNIDLRTHNDMTYIFGTDSANNNINVWVYKNSYLHQKSMEGDFSSDSIQTMLVVLIGGYLTAGGANAINMWYDRDIDPKMARTSGRAIPSGRVEAGSALFFGILISILGVWWFYEMSNEVAAFWSAFSVLFYVLIYSIWHKLFYFLSNQTFVCFTIGFPIIRHRIEIINYI